MKNNYIGNWETKHQTAKNKIMRENLFYEFISSARKRFVNRFELVGDPKLTKAKQILLFETIFNYGSAGIADILLLPKIQKSMVSNLSMTEYREIYDNGNTRFIVTPQAYWHDMDNNIAKAVALSAVKVSSQKYGIMVTNENCAFVKFDSDYSCGWTRWGEFAVLYSEAFTALRNKVLLSNAKVIRNSASSRGNDQFNRDLLDIDKVVVNKSPMQTTHNDNGTPTKVDLGKLLAGSDKLSRIDLNSTTKLNEIMDIIEGIKNNSYELYGERQELEFKKARNIPSDNANKEIFISLLEKSQLNQMEILVENYFKVYGIRLEVIDMVQKLKNEREEVGKKDDKRD